MEVSDNKEIVIEKLKNKNKSMRNYIVVTIFSGNVGMIRMDRSYSTGFIVRVFFFFFNKEEEILDNKNVRLE